MRPASTHVDPWPLSDSVLAELGWEYLPQRIIFAAIQ
jgi:hypothetical protein